MKSFVVTWVTVLSETSWTQEGMLHDFTRVKSEKAGLAAAEDKRVGTRHWEGGEEGLRNEVRLQSEGLGSSWHCVWNISNS